MIKQKTNNPYTIELIKEIIQELHKFENDLLDGKYTDKEISLLVNVILDKGFKTQLFKNLE